MKHGNALRRGLALVLSAAMAASSAFAVMDPDSRVHLNKTTSVEDMSDVEKTTITLSVGSEETTTGADVVFVLDKSTSTDVRDEALRMLGELQEEGERRDLDINVGAVIFNKSADNEGYVVGLKPLNESSVAELEEVFDKDLSSGTNIEAGIRKGIAMLEDDSSVPEEDKHLVLVTDGVTYLWGTEEPKTTYSELANTTATGTDYLNTDYHYRDDDYDAYSNAKRWMDDNEKGILETLEYEVSCRFDEQGNIITSINKGDITSIPAGEDYPYTALEIATYKAGKAWEDAATKGYNLYAYADPKYDAQYPWAPNFIRGLSTIGGVSGNVPENTVGMFERVKNSILYEIQDGTVTDPISDYFDWVGIDTVKLYVGGEVLEGETKGNTITYGDAYKVTYDEATRTLTWDINTPVAANAGLKLTYELKIDREAVSEAAASDSDFSLNNIPTNGDTVLKYTSTIDENDKEESFPIPKVTVNEKTPDPDPEPTPAVMMTSRLAAVTTTAMRVRI